MTISHSRTFLIGECEQECDYHIPAHICIIPGRCTCFRAPSLRGGSAVHPPGVAASTGPPGICPGGDLPDLSVRQPSLSTVSQPTPIL